LVEPAQASLPCCSVQPTEPDVVTIYSSDTEEALELLSLGPCRNLASQVLGGNIHETSASSGSDLFEDLPMAKDMAASIYVMLTAEASSSLISTADAPRGRWKSCNISSSTHSHSETAPPRRS
jgi:hypothetical protein